MVPTNPQKLREWYASDLGRKQIRYFLVSVISVAVSQTVLFVTYGPMRVGSARTCAIISTAVASVPSYYLNRAWAWGKTGRSHIWKEVVPFWSLAFVGLAFSLWSVDFAETHAMGAHLSHIVTSLTVNFASLCAYGVVWIGKFVIFEKFVFIDHFAREEDDMATAVES